MQERRKAYRRQSDKAMWQRVQQQQATIQQFQIRIDQQQAMIEQMKARDPSQLKRERRHMIRQECRVVVELPIGHSAGYGGDWSVDTVKFKGKLLDLSAGGASVYTKQQFETGQALRLTITVPNVPDIVANARVRWVKVIPEKGAHASGVEFIRMPEAEQARLAQYLEQLDAQSDPGD